MSAIKDLTGKVFGRLTVIEIAQRNPLKWLCQCECGNQCIIKAPYLNSGDTNSCGCLQQEYMDSIGDRRRIHGRSRDKVYDVWCKMISRCENENDKDYYEYGGSGVEVYPPWRESFEKFIEDVGERPKGHILDRIDGNGHYQPGNVRWATAKVSARNRNYAIMITAFGETKCISEWAEDPRCNCTYSALYQRITKLYWPNEKAITTPS
jgi:hypothetical protein